MKRKNVTRLIAALCVLCLFAGSFAFFTDRVDKNAVAIAGNIDLTFTDMSTFAEHKVDSQTNGYTDGKVWEDGKLVAENDIMNPGDNFDMGYKLANTGSKSIDVKQQITLTSDVALTDGAEEYKIVIAGQDITPVKSNEGKTLTYELDEIILSGSVEQDGTATEQEYDVYLAFSELARNKFMDSNVTVKLDVQAKQHRNTTDADWVEWSTYTGTVEQIGESGSNPGTGANITVSAKDSQNNDLNASASEITGDEKTDLLSKLEESGLVDSAADVDAMIEVESDDFEDMATTTFDVSSIAQEGDTVVILHFNEETQEWEFVSEETVNGEGKVTADFSSYSPVAFVVVKPDGTTEIITPEAGGDELVHEGIIPEGATYYVGVTSTKPNNYTGATTTLTAGDAFPATVTAGDVYIYGDYEYRYNYAYKYSGIKWNYTSTQNGWSARVLDDTKSSFGDILESINGNPVNNLGGTFAFCSNLTNAGLPAFSNNIRYMEQTFWMCSALETAPEIPDSVISLSQAFFKCTSLATAPSVIPENVTYLYNTFSGCTALTGTIEVRVSEITNGVSCFDGTTEPIHLTGTGDNDDVLNYLAGTTKNGNITF